MKRMAFDRAIAERVMGRKLNGYKSDKYPFGAMLFNGKWVPIPDFSRDHNAAAMVRERVEELGAYRPFLNHLADCVNAHWLSDYQFSPIDVWAYLRATPEQTARAAYLAVTGQELEAIDE